jgi:hypothetical protein
MDSFLIEIKYTKQDQKVSSFEIPGVEIAAKPSK